MIGDQIAKHPARFTLTCCTVVAALLVWWVQWSSARNLDRVCEDGSENRQLVIDVTSYYAIPVPVPADATAREAQQIVEANARAEALRRFAVDVGDPAPCADGIKPTSRLDELPR